MVNWTPYLLILAIPALAAAGGVIRRNVTGLDPLALAGAALVGTGYAVLAATTHEPGVPLGDAVTGVVAAGLLLGALPVYGFYRLGRALSSHPVTLGVICVATTVPLGYAYLIGWLFVLALVHCPPDAYECPV